MGNILNIDRLTADAIDLLKEMIAIPSPSFEEEEVCSHICSWLEANGIVHQRKGNNIIAEHITDTSRPTLMLCAHIDTVSPSTEYGFDPYTPDYKKVAENISSIIGRPTEAEEIVAGLGSNDDGASVVAMIAAYRYFQHLSGDSGGVMDNPSQASLGPSPCGQGGSTVHHPTGIAGKGGRPNLMLVLTCEEERSGNNGMTGLWPELESKVDSAIIGEPTGMKAATSERGLLVIDATAHGTSGHAARNEGKNALYIALDDINRLREHNFSRISPRMGKVNLNVTQISAGTAHNVIPDRCDFVIDIRPTEQYTNEEILKELQDIFTSELRPRNLANRSSATFVDSPLQKAAETLGIETFSSPTTSDWMRINCDAIKIGPGDSGRSHKKDEYVLVEEIRKGIEAYIEFINLL